jgi:RHS repeat-associated protein
MVCKSDISDADCLNGDTNMDFLGTGFPSPHAVSLVDGVSYTYDNNGNLTNNGERDYSWNIINQIESSGDMSFSYDHSGQRVKSVNSSSGEETIYINPYLEIRDGELIYYLYAGGQRVASIKDYGTPEQEITYFHQDHLGGIALATDEEGVVVQVNDYYPFGSSLLTSQLTSTEVNHSFTDKEYEEDLGLYYFEARWMDTNTGRFVSPDPLDGMTYTYAANNPLIIIDPTGLYEVETGTIELDDTTEIITDALSEALGIEVTWDDVVDTGFHDTDTGEVHFGEDFEPGDIVGWETIADASAADINNELDLLNQSTDKNLLSYLFYACQGCAGDIKDQENSVFGVDANGDRKNWAYVYRGELLRYDAPGNIHLSYVGNKAGYSLVELFGLNLTSDIITSNYSDGYDARMTVKGYFLDK